MQRIGTIAARIVRRLQQGLPAWGEDDRGASPAAVAPTPAETAKPAAQPEKVDA